MQIACNLVLDHPRLKIVNITDWAFYRSRLVRQPWPTDVVWLVTLCWYLPEAGKSIRGFTEVLSSPVPGRSVCILVNQPEEAETASGFPGVRVAWVNHNTFISPRLFTITGAEKVYDAVVNASPLPFKRVHLCAKVGNLCCIRRVVEPGTPDLFDAASLRPAFVNHSNLNKQEVAALLNQSRCGVILSAREGACFASTEYLFCGLPVVSTPSTGGRHVWYDADNSIIVEPDEDAVRDAVLELKRRGLEGSISPARIRENALKVRERFVANAREVIAQYLEEFGLSGEVQAEGVMRGWLAEADLVRDQFKYFPSEEAAEAYLRSGNLALWRRAVKLSAR